MDARDQLRRYLEQRRELGERELVLDGMSVEDVMRLLGAEQSAASGPPRSAATRGSGEQTAAPVDAPSAEARPRGSTRDPLSGSSDWREVLRAAGDASPEDRRAARESAPTEASIGSPPIPQPPPQPPPPAPEPPMKATQSEPAAGLVVGTSTRELFGGPFGHVGSVGELAGLIAKCTRCPLYATATNPVPGEGSPNAELVCVGEAPGQTEDETGRPFVGAAGQLLTKILAAINLRREDVFICNVLKHRPPGNRNPAPQEVEACSPYLVRQLELIRPRVVIAFGTFAAQTLLETKLSIGKLRGAVHRYYGVPLIVTYHPAALLRNPAWKRPTWEDVQLARRILDRAPGA